jgi:hypothetical protein
VTAAGESTVADSAFDGAKVFSATKVADRDQLGDRVTRWLREHTEYEIVDTVVTLSSDSAFHCLAITVFYRVKPAGGSAP